MTNNAYGVQALLPESTVSGTLANTVSEVSQQAVDAITVPAAGSPLVVPEVPAPVDVQPPPLEIAQTQPLDSPKSMDSLSVPGMNPTPLPKQPETVALPPLPAVESQQNTPLPDQSQYQQSAPPETTPGTPLVALVETVQPAATLLETLAQEPGQPITAPSATELSQLPQSAESFVGRAEQLLTPKQVPAQPASLQPETSSAPSVPAPAETRPLTASRSPIAVIKKIEEFFIRDVRPDRLAQRLEATVGHHIN